MPLDPSVLLSVRYPQYPDPMEEYKNFVSLRQMADLGRLRQVQLRQEELENQQKARDLADVENLRRNAGSLGADATVADYYRIGGPAGVKLYTENRQAQTAGLAQRKAQDELREKLRDEYINGLAVIANEPEGSDKQAMHTQLTTTLQERAHEMGIPGIHSMLWAAPPANQAEFRRVYLGRYGPVKAQELIDKIDAAARAKAQDVRDVRKDALQQSKDQLALADHYLGVVTAQPNQANWTKFHGNLPDELRGQLSPVFDPATSLAQASAVMQTTQQRQQAEPTGAEKWIAWKNQPGRTPQEIALADKNIKEITEYHQAIRPNMMADPSGLISTVLANPDLYDKLPADTIKLIAPGLAAAGFTGFGGRPTEGENKAARFYNRMKRASDIFNAQKDRIAKMTSGDQAWYRYGPMAALSEEDQQLRLAEQLWAEGHLRLESGAVIGDKEFGQTRGTYFIGAGDKPETIAQKLKAMQGEEASLKEEAGRAIKATPKEPPREPPKPSAQATPSGTSPKPIVPLSEVLTGRVEVKMPNGKTAYFASQAEADLFKKRAGIK